MMKKSILMLLGLCSLAGAKEYSESYAVVASEGTFADPAWKPVVEALVAKRGAEVITYQGDLENALPALKKSFPKYVCFVAKPEECGYRVTVAKHRMMRNLDDDPYTDAVFATITGYTPEDALRMAKATQPAVASTALISAGVGPERFKESYFINTHKPSMYGHKKPDGTLEQEKHEGDDFTARYIEYFETLDPDVVISSAHGSQRNLEMPGSNGNIICKDGKLFGKVTKERMIDPRTGQATNKRVSGKEIPIKEPKKPRIYFAAGNCLIGDIPDRNCMALAWMGFGKANQMIGYTATTWYGMVGWGANGMWEQSGGDAPLNECFYFANQRLMHRLGELNPQLAALQFDPGKTMSFRLIQKVIGEATGGKRVGRHEMGMLWDRDVVAFYGDPAHECRLDKKNTVPALYETRLSEKDGVFTLEITAKSNFGKASVNTVPLAEFLPHRVKNVKVEEGGEMKPVISDNFIMVYPSEWKKGETYRVKFAAEKM